MIKKKFILEYGLFYKIDKISDTYLQTIVRMVI